jgi:hypothetical protein
VKGALSAVTTGLDPVIYAEVQQPSVIGKFD